MPPIDLFALPASHQFFVCEFFDDGEHPKTWLAVGLEAPNNQAFVEQRRDSVINIDAGIRVLSYVFSRLGFYSDCFRAVECKASGKYRQTVDQIFFVVIEQVVAPRDSAAHRLTAFGQVLGSA